MSSLPDRRLGGLYKYFLAGGLDSTQWSDFGFWKEKTASALAEFELYLMLPKSAE